MRKTETVEFDHLALIYFRDFALSTFRDPIQFVWSSLLQYGMNSVLRIPGMQNLDILLDDDCILAINKPAGLPTQAPKQYDSIERRVRALLAARATKAEVRSDPRGEYLGIPHRIDRAATGVILLAKTPRAARVLSRQFERRQIRKLYWAIIAGSVDPPAGTWTDYVRKLPDVAKAEVTTVDAPQAQLARLHYRMLASTALHTHLEIELETGRTHQVRIQAASRGWPLLGDTLYGSAVAFGPVAFGPEAGTSDGLSEASERERAIALHARSIEFVHPTTQELTTVTADPPEWWPRM